MASNDIFSTCPKTPLAILHEYCQMASLQVAISEGLPNPAAFTATATVCEKVTSVVVAAGTGSGRSKQEAKQQAAKDVLCMLLGDAQRARALHLVMGRAATAIYHQAALATATPGAGAAGAAGAGAAALSAAAPTAPALVPAGPLGAYAAQSSSTPQGSTAGVLEVCQGPQVLQPSQFTQYPRCQELLNKYREQGISKTPASILQEYGQAGFRVDNTVPEAAAQPGYFTHAYRVLRCFDEVVVATGTGKGMSIKDAKQQAAAAALEALLENGTCAPDLVLAKHHHGTHTNEALESAVNMSEFPLFKQLLDQQTGTRKAPMMLLREHCQHNGLECGVAETAVSIGTGPTASALRKCTITLTALVDSTVVKQASQYGANKAVAKHRAAAQLMEGILQERQGQPQQAGQLQHGQQPAGQQQQQQQQALQGHQQARQQLQQSQQPQQGQQQMQQVQQHQQQATLALSPLPQEMPWFQQLPDQFTRTQALLTVPQHANKTPVGMLNELCMGKAWATAYTPTYKGISVFGFSAHIQDQQGNTLTSAATASIPSQQCRTKKQAKNLVASQLLEQLLAAGHLTGGQQSMGQLSAGQPPVGQPAVGQQPGGQQPAQQQAGVHQASGQLPAAQQPGQDLLRGQPPAGQQPGGSQPGAYLPGVQVAGAGAPSVPEAGASLSGGSVLVGCLPGPSQAGGSLPSMCQPGVNPLGYQANEVQLGVVPPGVPAGVAAVAAVATVAPEPGVQLQQAHTYAQPTLHLFGGPGQQARQAGVVKIGRYDDLPCEVPEGMDPRMMAQLQHYHPMQDTLHQC